MTLQEICEEFKKIKPYSEKTKHAWAKAFSKYVDSTYTMIKYNSYKKKK